MILDNCTYVTICLVLVILKTFNSFTVCGGSCLLLIGIIVAKCKQVCLFSYFASCPQALGKFILNNSSSTESSVRDLKFYIFLIENFCFQYFQALVIAETEANEML